MSNLIVRALSGLAYAILVLLACFSGPYGQIGLAAFLAVFSVLEWMRFGKIERPIFSLFLTIGIIFLALYAYTGVFEFSPIHQQIFQGLIVLAIAILLLTQAFHTRSIPSRLFHTSFSLIYIGFPLMLVPMMSNYQGENYPWMLASVFILIWCNDTFAYVFGKLFGKHKLFPRISPNKTWEGFLGGVVSTLVASYIFQIFFPWMPFEGWLGLALVVLVFGTMGDLFESALKRSYGMKDSGKFMPGHGGILDRIDSLLFALPMAYFYLRIFEYLH